MEFLEQSENEISETAKQIPLYLGVYSNAVESFVIFKKLKYHG